MNESLFIQRTTMQQVHFKALHSEEIQSSYIGSSDIGSSDRPICFFRADTDINISHFEITDSRYLRPIILCGQ